MLNERAAEALVGAAMRGVPQANGMRVSGDARCALGVIGEALFGDPYFTNYKDAGLTLMGKVTCPAGCWWTSSDGTVASVTHVNNFHKWDWLTIARKLGPDASGSGAA